MYIAFSSVLSLRAKSSPFHCNVLAGDDYHRRRRRTGNCCCCGGCCGCASSCNSSSPSLLELPINPRFLYYGGYLLRESALIRWAAPSRCPPRIWDRGLLEEMIGLLHDGSSREGRRSSCGGWNGVEGEHLGRWRFEVDVDDADAKRVLRGHGKMEEEGDSVVGSRKNGSFGRRKVVRRFHGSAEDGDELMSDTDVAARRQFRRRDRLNRTSCVGLSENADCHDAGKSPSLGSSSWIVRYSGADRRKEDQIHVSHTRQRRNDFEGERITKSKDSYGSGQEFFRAGRDTYDQQAMLAVDQNSRSNTSVSSFQEAGTRIADSSMRISAANLNFRKLNKDSARKMDSRQEVHAADSEIQAKLDRSKKIRDHRYTSQDFVPEARDSSARGRRTVEFAGVDKQHNTRADAYDSHAASFENSRISSSRLVEAEVLDRQKRATSASEMGLRTQHESLCNDSQSHDIFEDARTKRSEDVSTSVENFAQLGSDSKSLEQQSIQRVGIKDRYESLTNPFGDNESEAKRTSSSQRFVGDRVVGGEEYKTSVSRTENIDVLREERTNVLLSETEWRNRKENISHSIKNITQCWRNTKTHDHHESVSGRQVSDAYKTPISPEIVNVLSDDQEVRATRGNNQLHSATYQVAQISRHYDSRKGNTRDNNVPELSRSHVVGGSRFQEESSKTEKSKESSRGKLFFVGESSQSRGTQTTAFGDTSIGAPINAQILESDNRSRDGVLLESARRFGESSAFFVGEFIERAQQEISSVAAFDEVSRNPPVIQMEVLPDGGTDPSRTDVPTSTISPSSSTKSATQNYSPGRQSLSKSGLKGPSDDMWSVKDPSSKEPSKADETEEYSSPVGGVETNATLESGTAITRRAHRSLWAYVADIIKLGWVSRSGSHKYEKSRVRNSSNESVGTETWFSGEEQEENYETDNVTISKQTVTARPPSKRPDLIPQPIMHEENPGAPKVSDQPAFVSILGSTAMATGMASGTNRSESSLVGIDVEPLPSGVFSGVMTTGQPSESTGFISPSNVKGKISFDKSRAECSREEALEVDEKLNAAGQLTRRKLQRSNQVLSENFDEWELAFRLESQQRGVDEFFMKEALLEAKKAADCWEVPVGAVLVHDGKIIARGYNLVEELRDSTAHAEMICIRDASNHLRTWRLAETTLYVTLEPCPMCAGAILQSRIDTVVWGAPNKLIGADGSWIRLFPGGGSDLDLDPSSQSTGPVHPFHPKIVIRRGVLAAECSDAMQQFFQLRRKDKKVAEPPPPPPPPHCLPITTNPFRLLTKIQNVLCAMFCIL